MCSSPSGQGLHLSVTSLYGAQAKPLACYTGQPWGSQAGEAQAYPVQGVQPAAMSEEALQHNQRPFR